MISFIKKYTLLVAMVIGIAGYKWFSLLINYTPIMIFAMLLLTFSKIDIKNLKPQWFQFWLLLFEIGFSTAIYYIVMSLHFIEIRERQILAQGAMICVMCPTATAAAVVTGKLGGNIAATAAYTLFANIAVAIAAPLLFPLMSDKDIIFTDLFFKILKTVFLLLICPFLIVFAIRFFMPKLQKKIENVNGLAFYIWAICLIIAIAKVAQMLIEENYGGKIELLLGAISLILCVLQFFVGKIIGGKYGERIAGGQALGQKNTILAVWLAQQYLNPISAVAAGAYIVWQNVINSWQLYLRQKKLEVRN
ncbi:MAG: bile acid:sodium symporter [Prevotellaceae bacterium]|jgi:BASS family bile acid:Na+ symporter|nr:bile acid:sodium symporter [Prevotellaceae bacterium]